MGAGAQWTATTPGSLPSLAASVAGALPLGIVFTSSEAEEVCSQGISLLKSIMPEDAFYGRGRDKGPAIMMTDDSGVERASVTFSFPGIILLLCHVLQAFLRYVFDSKHKVPVDNREAIYGMFHDWCYCKTREEFESKYDEMMKNPMIANNKWLVKKLKKEKARAEQWALCMRDDLLIRGNNTNNYSERTVLRYRNELLDRLRAYSIVQLFDFFTTRLDAFFERQIAAVVNNRKENYWASKHWISLESLQCTNSDAYEDTYYVENLDKGTRYMVNMDVQICECLVGRNGAPCKHQFVVAQKFQLSTSQFLPYADEKAKAVLHQIMTATPAKSGWYASLHSGPHSNGALQSGNSGQPESCPQDASSSLVHDLFTADVNENENSSAADSAEDEDLQICLAEAKDIWECVKAYIDTSLEKRPETFSSAVLTFGTRLMKAKDLSENTVPSALHNFSNTWGERGLSARSRYIKVNKAACIRRMYTKMGGRKVTRQGRPPQSAIPSEHGYSGRGVIPAWDKTNTTDGPVPHRLALRLRQQVENTRTKAVTNKPKKRKPNNRKNKK